MESQSIAVNSTADFELDFELSNSYDSVGLCIQNVNSNHLRVVDSDLLQLSDLWQPRTEYPDEFK